VVIGRILSSRQCRIRLMLTDDLFSVNIDELGYTNIGSKFTVIP
jgi:hypothetical protein